MPDHVIETGDRGFLMIGETGYASEMSAKVYIVKTDSAGALLWQKEFGSAGFNLGNCVVEAPDGNYIAAGALNHDAWLIKLNASDGNPIWQQTWDLGTEDAFEGVDITGDGAIIATGYRDGNAEGTFLNWGKGVLMEVDASSGKQVWYKDISSHQLTLLLLIITGGCAAAPL